MGSGAVTAWHEELALRVVEELALPGDPADTIRRVLARVREQTGLAVAAIRLRDGEDFPYHLSEGLSEEHLRRERSVLAEETALDPGAPPLVCLCGRVLRGELDPALGCFSAGGSFFTPSLQTLQRTLHGIRGGCVREGLETHALIPLRDGGETTGLLQLSDPRVGVLSVDDVRFLERLGASVGIALARRRSEELRQQTEKTYRGLFEHLRWGYAHHRIIRDERGEAVDYVTLEVNHAYEELLRTPHASVLGRNASELLPPAELARWLAIFGPIAAGGEPASYELYSPSNDRFFRGHAYSFSAGTFSVAFEDVTAERRSTQALGESEERFHKAFRAAPVLMALSRVENGRYLEVNDSFCATTGLSREEVLGATSIELGLLSEAHRARLLDELRRDGRVRGAEVEFLGRDGRRVSCRASIELVTVGEEQLLLSIAADLSEERRAHAALRESRELFERAFRSAPVLMALSRIEDGRYLEVNDRFCEVSGVTREEALGKTSVELGWISAGDRARTLERLQREGRVRDVVMRRAGRVVSIHGELVSVGNERLLLSIGQDLTDEQRAREALRESEMRFRELADLLPLAVFEADRDGRLAYANQVAHSLFGHTPEQLAAGLNAAAMIDPSDRERAMRTFAEVMQRGAGTGNAYLGLRRDGESFPIRIYSSPIVRGGEVRGIRGVIVDETATRRGEEERERLQTQLMHAQRMESIGTLAGGIAHDFNNLLGGILGSLSLMEEELGEGFAFHEDLLEMKGLVARGADLTRQLLGFARRSKPDPRPLDLNLIVEKTARLYGRTRKDVVLRLEREPQLPTVLADRTQLEQVLLNLMLNAGQAMPEGGVLLVRTSALDLSPAEAESHRVAPGRFIRLDLIDTGVGIAPETLPHIFEPFFTTREGKGSGLGLPSVLGIVTGHGGFVTVESQPGEGATFSVHLPASEEPLLEEIQAAGAPRRGGETVLVVDDEEPVLRVTGRLLERLGHRVLKARSGLEALELLRRGSERVGLVILDMIMPGMNGRQTFDALRELAPELKVLIASGHSEEGQAADLLARGCLGFIQKPFDVARLAAKLAEIL